MSDEHASSFRCRGSGQSAQLDKFGHAVCPVCGWTDLSPQDSKQITRDWVLGRIQPHEEDTPSTYDPGRNRVAHRGPTPR